MAAETPTFTQMDYSLEATYYRTGLLLGLIGGAAVQRWAERAIEREPVPPREFIELASLPVTDLSGLRHALWPLVVDPEPRAVLDAMFGQLQADLASGRRGTADTLTVLRQMRSMLRLPPLLNADLNSLLIASEAEGASPVVLVEWLQQFAQVGLAPLQPDAR